MSLLHATTNPATGRTRPASYIHLVPTWLLAVLTVLLLSVTTRATAQPATADLSLKITPVDASYPLDQDAVISVAFTNNGPAPVEQVYLNYTMYLFGADLVSIESTAGTIETADTFISLVRNVRVPAMEPGQTETVTITLRGKSQGSVNNSFTVGTNSEATMDPNPENNSGASRIVFQGRSDITLQTSVSPASAQPGGTLIYTTTVTNLGPDEVRNIYLTNAWEATTYKELTAVRELGPLLLENPDLVFDRFQAAGDWVIHQNGGDLHAYVNRLAPGQSASLILFYRVANSAQGDAEGNIVQTVAATGVEGDPIANNIDTVSTPVTAGGPGADLQITHTSSASTVNSGQQFTYTITGINHGTEAVSAASISALLPAGGSVASAVADRGTVSFTGNFVEVTNIALAPTEVVTLTINYVAPQQSGVATAESTIGAERFDPNLANNLATLAVTVVGPVPCNNAIDLASGFTKVKTKSKLKKKIGELQFSIQAQVEVSTAGTECAPPTVARLYLSNDPILDPSDILLDTRSVSKKLCPGKKAKKVKFKVKNLQGSHFNPAGRFLIAVADGDNVLVECDEQNNTSFYLN